MELIGGVKSTFVIHFLTVKEFNKHDHEIQKKNMNIMNIKIDRR